MPVRVEIMNLMGNKVGRKLTAAMGATRADEVKLTETMTGEQLKRFIFDDALSHNCSLSSVTWNQGRSTPTRSKL